MSQKKINNRESEHKPTQYRKGQTGSNQRKWEDVFKDSTKKLQQNFVRVAKLKIVLKRVATINYWSEPHVTDVSWEGKNGKNLQFLREPKNEFKPCDETFPCSVEEMQKEIT